MPFMAATLSPHNPGTILGQVGRPSRLAYSHLMKSVTRLFPCAFALISGPAMAQQDFDDYFWSSRVSSGFDYSAGRYGQTETTKIVFVPLAMQTTRGPITFKLSTGWLRVSGPALILDGAATEGAAQANRKVSGIADVSLSAMYSFEQFYDRGIYLDLTARAKFPAASFAKGLGTGEVDGALQLDGAFSWGKVMPFGTIGYKANGTPDTLALRNVAYGSLGLQYAWNDRTATGVAYDWRQSSLATSQNPREGMVYTSYKFTDAWSVNVYGVAGFSDNSPNAGGGITITYRIKPGSARVVR